MPDTKQTTAMMQLRDRLQAITISTTNKWRRELSQIIIDSIDTELLAVEKQTIVDAFNAGAKENGEWKDSYQNADIYYELTFKPQ